MIENAIHTVDETSMYQRRDHTWEDISFLNVAGWRMGGMVAYPPHGLVGWFERTVPDPDPWVRDGSLPDDGERVLVSFDEYTHPAKFTKRREGDGTFESIETGIHFSLWSSDIAGWMPLPEPVRRDG